MSLPCPPSWVWILWHSESAESRLKEPSLLRWNTRNSPLPLPPAVLRQSPRITWPSTFARKTTKILQGTFTSSSVGTIISCESDETNTYTHKRAVSLSLSLSLVQLEPSPLVGPSPGVKLADLKRQTTRHLSTGECLQRISLLPNLLKRTPIHLEGYPHRMRVSLEHKQTDSSCKSVDPRPLLTLEQYSSSTRPSTQ